LQNKGAPIVKWIERRFPKPLIRVRFSVGVQFGIIIINCKSYTLMLGAIIGDIAGSRFEFDEPPRKGFKFFSPDCGYTDDTVCTVAIADAIINGKSYKESLLKWCRKYPTPKGGYGNRFNQWIHSDDPQPNDSCGNGAAMRASAVGWLFDDYHTILEEAKKSAEISHNNPEGIKGAQCIAALIYWLRTCRIGKEDVEKSVMKAFEYEIPPLDVINTIGASGHFDAICQETVPWAIRCFLEADNFEDTIRLAIMADGDTDTKANIAGAIAEAYYDIPDNIADAALEYLPKDMLGIISDVCSIIKERINKG
jgi:ADP-ribosyl-[dinitrogen reductase] hydrolase